MKALILTGILALASSASAITFAPPLTLSDPFLAGILNGQPGNSNLTTEKAYAQFILDLSIGEKEYQDGTPGLTGDPNVFEANELFEYNGTVTTDGEKRTAGIDGINGVAVEAGWGGALAKYDGPNGGYVLFLFGGTASNIPEYPIGFFDTGPGQNQISHYTLFNGTGGLTPDPQGVVPEGGAGVALFGLLLAGMGFVRARLRRA